MKSATLTAGWIAMLPILRNSNAQDGELITDRAFRSHEQRIDDISQSPQNGTSVQRYTAVNDGDFVFVWGVIQG